MLKTTFITQFLFQNAQYYLSNQKGSELVLKINYQKNSFLVKNLGVPNQEFSEEAKKIAQSLLIRKHNINFADHNK